MPERAKKPVPEAGSLPLEDLQQIKDDLVKQEDKEQANETKWSLVDPAESAQDLKDKKDEDFQQSIDELFLRFNEDLSESKTEVAGLAAEGEKLVDEGLEELGNIPEAIPLATEAAAAKNTLLGAAEEAEDEFNRIVRAAEEYVHKNQVSQAEQRVDEPGVLNLDQFTQAEKKAEVKITDGGPVKEIPVEEVDWDALFAANEQPESSKTPEILLVKPEISTANLLEGDTSVKVENSTGGKVKEEIPLYSRANVNAFKKLGAEAKKTFVDFYTRTILSSSGARELRGDQKLIAKSEDRLHGLNGDLTEVDDKLGELKDQLMNIDEVMGQLGDAAKPKEIKALEKSRQILQGKIKKEEAAKDLLSQNLKAEKEKQAGLQEGLKESLVGLELKIDKSLEPYKQEVVKLESDQASLVEEKNNFEALIDDFNDRLNGLKEQLVGLAEMAMPKAARKSFKAVLKRKIGDVETALKTSQNNLARLENNIVRINGRLNKEDIRINKWESIRAGLKAKAEEQPEKVRQELSGSYISRDRTEPIMEKVESPVFSASAYIDKWNSLSKNDGLTLNKEAILSSSKKELTLERLESLIKTTRFKGLSERQLKKRIQEKIDLLRVHFGVH
ncbi:MAG: hypothetical protein A3B89_00830 [Candidatus Buchananbacteria bacterium RIFCSPHIGHO2_02_FULL_40_13]|uniref:Uncharacterized protein n=1 Tax=Candidatus Buchananbacteria bacterium RIFCSPLOWO2_01_FULL_39_33 TaxID=1797543 RepID=A0A1G1YGR9_9BACT|nr:MAG: hypothetical protein A2820_00895 [Candidatus Buchananbacteria bacterium RIFCSPHIGHO2_01_FULL_40_35]OGY50418.1 MAG: hypothetical protein A3B89_00830 [Candidatus Buchananbacteria bacterium RIFCSPHIGHO2_02_FULL_40_13]OGY51558.1 MAG: hypothetical protein A3A02_01985 [Candidatus Buchananbacteria bacterium RIFCSPLOWO2_01_FULL_39_33]